MSLNSLLFMIHPVSYPLAASLSIYEYRLQLDNWLDAMKPYDRVQSDPHCRVVRNVVPAYKPQGHPWRMCALVLKATCDYNAVDEFTCR